MKLFGLNIFEKRSEETQNLKPVEESAAGFSLNFALQRVAQSTTLSAVYSAVSIISNSIAQLPLYVRNRTTKEVVDHPIKEIFYNSLISKFVLIKQLVSDMLINGSGIAYIHRDEKGQPTHLTYCARGEWSREYNPLTGQIIYQIPKIKSTNIYPKDVIDIYKDTMNGVEGKGLIFYALRTLQSANAAENASLGYYESGCTINGILKSSRRLSTKQTEAIRSAWNTAHASTNQNNIAVMDIDLDYVPLSSNANDAQLLETRQFNILEVARYFNIPPVKIGYVERSVYTSLEQTNLQFVNDCISPLVSLIQEEINRKLFDKEDNLYIDFDETYLLKADKQSMATYINTLTKSGVLSINEARQILEYGPIKNGENHYIPYTDLNQNSIESNNPQKQKEDE